MPKLIRFDWALKSILRNKSNFDVFTKINLIMIICLLIINGCASFSTRKEDVFFSQVESGTEIAVSYFYHAEDGAVTKLSKYFRDQVEGKLDCSRFKLVPREDLSVLFEEIDEGRKNVVNIHSSGRDDNQVDVSANTFITGRYYLHQPKSGQVRLEIRLISNKRIVGTKTIIEALPNRFEVMHSDILGNIYEQNIVNLKDETRAPKLIVNLDRNPACYPPESKMQISVQTEVGVYLYILGLQADGTGVMLYPNRYQQNVSLKNEILFFPPKEHDKIKALKIHADKPGEAQQESVKIIASYEKLDFDFLPVPTNTTYCGIKGGDLKKVYEELKKHTGFTPVSLPFQISVNCQ